MASVEDDIRLQTGMLVEALRENGFTFAAAESCTGGAIGAALTDIPGSSSVYKGGIICYTNWVKEHLLDVDEGEIPDGTMESYCDDLLNNMLIFLSKVHKMFTNCKK